MPNYSKTPKNPAAIDWKTLASDRKELLSTIKKGEFFIKFLNAMDKFDITPLIEEDGTVSAGKFIRHFTTKEYSIQIGFPSVGILCMLDVIAKQNRSDYCSDKATDFPQYSVGVPVIPARFRSKVPYSAWTWPNSELRAAIFGKALSDVMDSKKAYSAALDEIMYLNERCGIPLADIKDGLHNSKFQHRPLSMSKELISSFKLKQEQLDKVDVEPYNALDSLARCMILNDWVFSSSHPNLLRCIVNLDNEVPHFNYNDSGPATKNMKVNIGILSLLDDMPAQVLVKDPEDEPKKKTKHVNEDGSDTPW